MTRTYAPLASSGIVSGVGFDKPPMGEYPPVSIDDPAEKVMTDFRVTRALTIQATTSMQSANNKMIANGVRMLLVVDIHNFVIGLITASDILGEKPVRIVQERGIDRTEVLVGDIMTSRERLEAVDMRDLAHARVGHVVATLRTTGRRHALVVETDDMGRQTVRGLFSATQVEKQIGTSIDTPEVARSFAEVGEALTR
jgi:signal-transduction protein with cAMP-binding, CBS, and nucleotidyltransferase domain